MVSLEMNTATLALAFLGKITVLATLTSPLVPTTGTILMVPYETQHTTSIKPEFIAQILLLRSSVAC